MLVAARNPHFGPARKALKGPFANPSQTLRASDFPALVQEGVEVLPRIVLVACQAVGANEPEPPGRAREGQGGPGPPGINQSPCPKNQLYQWVIGKTRCSWLVVYLPS